MNKIENDLEYLNIVGSILYDDKFNELKKIEHHGVTRYDHSVKISYCAYKIAKAIRLNYKNVARGGLLHDFFLSDHQNDTKLRIKSVFRHARLAEKRASEIYGINKMEADIIKSHMFPIGGMTVPKYLESWLVNSVDKTIGFLLFFNKFNYKLSYALNFMIIFVLNFRK